MSLPTIAFVIGTVYCVALISYWYWREAKQKRREDLKRVLQEHRGLSDAKPLEAAEEMDPPPPPKQEVGKTG